MFSCFHKKTKNKYISIFSNGTSVLSSIYSFQANLEIKLLPLSWIPCLKGTYCYISASFYQTVTKKSSSL